MPRRAKAKGLYQRGAYWLDWDRRTDGSLRSPNLAIFWYDPARGRIRSVSAGTPDLAGGQVALDRHFLESTQGSAFCPTCGQRRPHHGAGMLAADALADYVTMTADRTSAKAIQARVAHLLDYLDTLKEAAICDRIDGSWVERFRKWSAHAPVILSTGKARAEPRSAGTTENSVIALAAAINAAHRRGDTAKPAQFRPIQTKELNQTPQYRLSIDQLAAGFRYCFEKTHRKNERVALRQFLMAAVSTAARPDAIADISTDPARRQWNGERQVLALNQAGRRQTRKRRAVVRVPWQFARQLDAAPIGLFVTSGSVRSAWRSMRVELGWPEDGEAGMKLVRRSIAQLLRDAGTPRAWSKAWRDPSRKVPGEEIELLLGHRALDSVTDIYAAFDPAYLSTAVSALEAIIDEIEARTPGAFHRSFTGEDSNIVPIAASKKAR